MSSSEILTILIFFHHCQIRNFKHYYLHYVGVHLSKDFPNLVSYNRFIQWMPSEMIILLNFVLSCCLGNTTGTYYIDSCPLKVSHNLRIPQHKTFDGIARSGKTSVGWFFGFKLHLVINHLGEIVAFFITPGNVSDINARLIQKLTKGLRGEIFGDKGYISKKVKTKLKEQGLELVTKIRKNMKPRLLPHSQEKKLQKRAVIECVINALKNKAYVEHARHRSFVGMINNITAAIAAYHFFDQKPKVEFDIQNLQHKNQVAIQ